MTVYINGTTGYSGPVGTIGDLTTTGNTTLGDASGDTLTINGSTTTLTQGTANGVAYLNGSKALTTGSALTFDGTNLGIGETSPASYGKLVVSGPAYSRGSGNAGRFSAIDTQVGGATLYLNAAFGLAGTPAVQVETNHPLLFATNNTERMRLDASGNLGLSATPSAWGSGYPVLEIGGTNSYLAFNSTSNSGWTYWNMYYDGTNNKIKRTGYFAAYGQDGAGKYIWYNGTGTAGATASLNAAMTLTAAGSLLINTTSADVAGVTARLSVNGGMGFAATNVNTGTASYSIYQLGNNNGVGRGGIALLGSTFPSSGVYQQDGVYIYGANTGGITLAVETAYPIYFATNNLERARITGSGAFGILTNSPQTNTDIGGTSAQKGLSIRCGDDNVAGQGGIQMLFTYNGNPWNSSGYSHAIKTRHDSAGGATNAIDFYLWNTNVSASSIPTTKSMSVTATGVAITGSLSKGSGSFRIDHPLPELEATHQLVHSFIEGPQADNIYRGKVALIGGVAAVNIDQSSGMTEGTFVLLNREVQCFTTNETGWVHVRGSVASNVLTIEAQDNTCTDTISWMVIGERHDKHMYDTDWTDNNGKVIVEPLKTN